MTRSDLVALLSTLYPQADTHLMEDAVALFFFEIGAALQRGDRVELRGFGSFCLRKRKEKIGRNPKTGERVTVEEKWAPFFKAGKELKEIVNLEKNHYIPPPQLEKKQNTSRYL